MKDIYKLTLENGAPSQGVRWGLKKIQLYKWLLYFCINKIYEICHKTKLINLDLDYRLARAPTRRIRRLWPTWGFLWRMKQTEQTGPVLTLLEAMKWEWDELWVQRWADANVPLLSKPVLMTGSSVKKCFYLNCNVRICSLYQRFLLNNNKIN